MSNFPYDNYSNNPVNGELTNINNNIAILQDSYLPDYDNPLWKELIWAVLHTTIMILNYYNNE